jgi:hypothetical protein
MLTVLQFALLLLFLVGTVLAADEDAFPALIPMEKPADRPLSAAMQRLYEERVPYRGEGEAGISVYVDDVMILSI